MSYAKIYDTAQDFSGQPVSGASVTITDYTTGSLATLYEDDEATTKGNPLTTDARGHWEANVSGAEYTIVVAKDGDTLTRTKIPVVVAGTSLTSSAGSSTDNAIARWDGTGGDTVQNSAVVIDDSGNVTGLADVSASGTVSVDTIAESTADAGVTVDGVVIKDGAVSYDYLGPPSANKTLTVGAHDIQWDFTAAGGSVGYNWTGAATGNLFELVQQTGDAAAGTHLLHAEANDADVTGLYLEHHSASGNALEVAGGIVDFTAAEYVNFSGTTISNLGTVTAGAVSGLTELDMASGSPITNAGGAPDVGSVADPFGTGFFTELNLGGSDLTSLQGGTANTLQKADGSDGLSDSSITDDGSEVEISAGVDLLVGGNGTGTGTITNWPVVARSTETNVGIQAYATSAGTVSSYLRAALGADNDTGYAVLDMGWSSGGIGWAIRRNGSDLLTLDTDDMTSDLNIKNSGGTPDVGTGADPYGTGHFTEINLDGSDLTSLQGGTANTLQKADGSDGLSDSSITDDGSDVEIASGVDLALSATGAIKADTIDSASDSGITFNDYAQFKGTAASVRLESTTTGGDTWNLLSSVISGNGSLSFYNADEVTSYIAAHDTQVELGYGGDNVDLVVQSGAYTYYGDPSTNGSWRQGRSGDDFITQRRESGSWVTKQTISA